jgi:membrane-bound metal-dependent hydrolase YbcI (DUF457 family)
LFIGHIGVALAAKRAAPKVSLGTLILATSWIDLVWPILLLFGIEHVSVAPGITAFTPLDFTHYPFTHSLVMVIAWGLLLGGGYFLVRPSVKDSVVIGCVVVSHWVLDWLTHRPDLPLYLDGPKLGFGLWNSIPLTIAVESLIFVVGVLVYYRMTRPSDRVGTWSFWSLIAALVFFYIMNIVGPPPPDEKTLAWVALAAWLFPVWGYWIDRHRIAV